MSEGKKKNLNRLKSVIQSELQSLELEAEKLKSTEGDDVDKIFQMIRKKVEERYEALKEQQREASSTAIVRDLERLKREATSSNANKLKEVHKEISDLKTTVLFASPPPRINTESIFSAIEHIGVESDSEDTDEIVEPTKTETQNDLDADSSPSPDEQLEPETPFKSYSSTRQPSRSFSRNKSSDSDRTPARSVEPSRPPARHVSEERQDFDSISFSSHQSSLHSAKKPDPTPKQTMLSPNDLLGPGAFTATQPKPSAKTQPVEFHRGPPPRGRQVSSPAEPQVLQNPAPVLQKPAPAIQSPGRQLPSPIPPRSPSPKNYRSSTPGTPAQIAAELSAAEAAKRQYHYFNPDTQTIELTDTSLTPERKPQSQSENNRRSLTMEKSRTTPVRRAPSPVYQVPDRVTSPVYQDPVPERVRPSERIPLPGQGPVIKDLCANKRIKRYFTESSQYSNPAQDSWCTIEELYSPSQFFVLPKKNDVTRDRVQIYVANYIHTNKPPATKSHAVGKMVLCLFSDQLWYRACIIRTQQDNNYTVLFVDYGNQEENVSYQRLRDMHDDILELQPMCVQQCYLAGIMPPDRGQMWDPSTVEALWDLVAGRPLKITTQTVTDQVYGVVLEVEEGNSLVNINEHLVELQFAIRNQVETVDPMKSLCTSPTRFTPPSNSLFQSTKPAAQPVQSFPPRKTRNRSPPPASRQPRDNPVPATRQPRDELPPVPVSTRQTPTQRNRHPSHSDSSEEENSYSPPSVGRPPSFGSAGKQAPRPVSHSPPFVFGDTSAVGRGNVFNSSTRPPGGSNFSSEDRGYEIPAHYEIPSDLSDPDGRKSNRFQEVDSNLPPPNFKISYQDLECTAVDINQTNLLRSAGEIPSTFQQRSQSPDRRHTKSPVDQDREPETNRGSKSESTGTDRSEARSNKTFSSGIDVISDHETENRAQTKKTVPNSFMSGGMDGLEGDEEEDFTPGNNEEQLPELQPESESLTAKLQEILYDPKSYLLGDLTVEKVYSEYSKREVTRLPTELLSEETRLLPVVVTHVESPELFCVSLLSRRHIAVLDALTASLNLLYSNKPVYQSRDKVTRNVGGTVWKGEVISVNHNLLQVKWEGSDTQQWIQDDLVEKEMSGLSEMISNQLAVSACKVEFSTGEFCAARFTCPAGSVSWYRALVLETFRKGSTKRVYKYMVLFVDYGNVESVDVQHARPLPAKFSKLPAQSIPCYLPEIQAIPPDDTTVVGDEEEGMFESDSDDDTDDSPIKRCQYSRSARQAFSDLILNERVYLNVQGDVIPLYYGYRQDVPESDDNALVQFLNSSLPVSIVDRIEDNILVNIADEYVRDGHAERILNLDCGVDPDNLDPTSSARIEERMSALDAKLKDMEQGRRSPLTVATPNSELSSDVDSETKSLSSFDPMSDDFNSESNLADHDRDDVGQAVYGQKLERRTLCRFFSRGRTCYKGRNCRYLHQKKSDFNSLQSEQAMVIQNKPPSPTNDMPVIVQVTSVLTPFHFWVQILPHDINPGAIEQENSVLDPLSELTRKMNSMYRYKGYRETKYYPAIGEIVAVKSMSADSYRRSRVTETDEVGEGMCKVFHLDYGTFEIVHEKALRVMDPAFIKELPFQAQEMTLADVKPAYPIDTEPVFVGKEEVSRGSDAAAAREYFLSKVSGKWMIAKVIERRPGGPLNVHLWDCSTDNYVSINKELVKEGFAETVYQLPDELTTDCGTLASSSYQQHSD